MRPLRVAFATWSSSVVGGTESCLRAAAGALKQRGHAVALLHEMAPAWAFAPVVPSAAGIPQWSAATVGRGEALDALANWGLDIVFAHGLTDSCLEDALLTDLRCVLFAHGN